MSGDPRILPTEEDLAIFKRNVDRIFRDYDRARQARREGGRDCSALELISIVKRATADYLHFPQGAQP